MNFSLGELFYMKSKFFLKDLWPPQLYDPFLLMGLNCLKVTEPPQGDNLIFTTKSPEIPGTHLIDLGSTSGWVDLGATQTVIVSDFDDVHDCLWKQFLPIPCQRPLQAWFFEYFYNFKAFHTILTKYKSKWVAKKSLKFASLNNYFCKIFTNILKLQTFSNFSHLVSKDFQVWSRTFFQKDKLLFSRNMTAFRVASKALKTKENFADNGGHNILRIFDILPNLSSTAIKAGFDLLIKKKIHTICLTSSWTIKSLGS